MKRKVGEVQGQERENIDPRRKEASDVTKMQKTTDPPLSRHTRSTASTTRKFGVQVDPTAVAAAANQETRQAAPTPGLAASKLQRPQAAGSARARFGFGFQPAPAATTTATQATGGPKGVSIPVVPRVGGRRRAPTPVPLAPPAATDRVEPALKTDDPDRDEEDNDMAGGQEGAGVREASERCLSQRVSEAEVLIKTKIKISARADIKEKLGKRDEAIKALREGLSSLLQATKEFDTACGHVEAGLRTQVKSEQDNTARATEKLQRDLKHAQDRAAALEAELKQVRQEGEENLTQASQREAELTDKLESTESQLSEARAEAAQAVSDCDKLRSEVVEKEQTLSTTGQAAQEKEAALREEVKALSDELQRLKEDKAALEATVTDLSSRLREGESLRAADASEKSRMEADAARLTEEVRELRASLSDRAEEVGELKLQAEKRAAELAAENIELQSRRREEETARVKAEEEVQRLTSKLDGIRDAIDEKNKELSQALKSFTDMQRSTQERETELRKTLKESEERASRAEHRCSEIEAQVQQLKTEAASSGVEVSALREALGLARDEAAAKAQENTKAQTALQEATAKLAVEVQLRARAEVKEEEERRERVAANAQLLAMQQAHAAEMEALRVHETEVVSEWAGKVKANEEDRERLLRDLRDAQESSLTLDRELKALKTELESAEERTAQLAELGKVAGEADIMRHRLIESEKERVREEEKFRAQIVELEGLVQKGEKHRRALHNQIQELRGNVRVFARVRPFLPSDKGAACTLPCIEVNANDESMAIRKVGPDGAAILESHRFSFDKCFAPSIGQEAVFAEVSDLVQSALDGYNVCLFSYGQTGSGKTHTMQGFGQGIMRGIIPRAMERVGQYKTELEGQGWVYSMEVTFIEIYNETVKDLLRSLNSSSSEPSSSDPSPDIRRDTKGNVYLAEATVVPVDPNDTQTIERIMEVAARHRSVGSTDMNAVSSRSHSVFTLHLHAKNADQRAELRGKLNLVDLAGSERLSRSGATGDRLKETQAINKSLSALTDVFVAIGNKQSHVPFRNSKLTYLLQQCLSGDGKTLMMVNLSPADESYFESLCSLRFAQQVNKCELGRPRRNLQTHFSGNTAQLHATSASSSSSSSASSSSTVVVERASTLSAPTAASSSKAASAASSSRAASFNKPAAGGGSSR